MVLQDLVEINKAEDEANKIVSEAEIKSKQIIKNAEEEANKFLAESTIKVKKDFVATVDDIVSTGKKEIDKILEAGKIEVDDILNLSETKLEEAMNLIIKEVVGNYGNN